ncbi:MAG: glycoside hydrolase family 3 C-terminal domain-containing protein [Beijerinckiaceae bacterium]|nr:glycoside hydrolase family 3 C-terminal domain-containing protein [Beijerinckiaceae bacterium]
MGTAGASARVRALMERMTLEEKLGQLSMLADGLVETGPPGPHNPFTMVEEGRVGSILNVWGRDLVREAQRKAVEDSRLGIPLFFGLDVVHGHRSIHPVPLAEACSFDRALWEETARDNAIEAATDGVHMTFAPMLDVSRDARWGRIVECAGEDPLVNAEYGRARVRGYQKPDPAGFMRLAACAKHFCAYGAVISGRDYGEADVSQRALEEVYLPPFRAVVEEGVAAIMPAFVDVAGVAMTAHKRLLREVLRAQWRFDGLIISDYNAVAELINHGVAADLSEAGALALKAGVDIDMMGDAYIKGLPDALARGDVTMDEIDEALVRVLSFKESLGLFEDPYRGIGADISPSHAQRRARCRAAAIKSMVLVKNDGVLPLRSAERIALVGPMCDAPADQLGAWASAGAAEDSITLLAGVRERFSSVAFAAGSGLTKPIEGGAAQARAIAADADVVLLCLGEERLTTGEACSRTRPELPQCQIDLARDVYASGKPVVLALGVSRPLVLPDWLVEGARAILITWHAGSEAGPAFADIVSGAANPSAKLCVSWPASLGQMPVFYGMRPSGRPHDPGNGWSTGFLDAPFAPRWSFGDGLSYTRFTRSHLRCDAQEIDGAASVTVSLDVANSGNMAGIETIFLFIRDPVARVTRPMLELKDFTRVELAPGETKTVHFILRAADFSYRDENLKLRLDDGLVHVFAGAGSRAEDLDRVDVRVVNSAAWLS